MSTTIEEIEARLRKLKYLPWHVSNDEPSDVVVWGTAPDGYNAYGDNAVLVCNVGQEIAPIGVAEPGEQEVGEFIAAAPTDIAYLLDRVRRLEADVDKYMHETEKELCKLQRAHAYLVESTDGLESHMNDPLWVAAKELRL